MGKFEDQVKRSIRNYEKRYRATARLAVQDTISMSQRTQPEGGHKRVDTGFLRASIQAGLDTMPGGPTENEGGYGGKRKYQRGAQAAGSPTSVVLLQWDPTKRTLFVGWTANYARVRESKDGFARLAIQKWDKTVSKAAMKAGIGIG